jgi:hypothetical protein
VHAESVEVTAVRPTASRLFEPCTTSMLPGLKPYLLPRSQRYAFSDANVANRNGGLAPATENGP